MNFGIPLEKQRTEHRVGMTPRGVRILRDLGHRIFVQTGAGDACRFDDIAYRDAGAEIVFRPEEVYGRSDVVVAVNARTLEDIALIREGQIVFAFWHLAVGPKTLVTELVQRKVTAVAFEMVEDRPGHRPVLTSMSEIAGQMAVQTAAYLLQRECGGRGILLGAIPGTPPATVLILGAGTAGTSAADAAVGAGARVIMLDKSIEKLRKITNSYGGRVATSTADRDNIARYIPHVDVVIGAVLVPSGAQAPYLVSRDMVKTMRPGSVVVDLSIDQGGCIESSRPTTIEDPTFIFENVVHYCVPNMTANMPRTASDALTHAHLTYLEKIADEGLEKAIRNSSALARGTCMYRGAITQAAIADLFGLPHRSIYEMLPEGRP